MDGVHLLQGQGHARTVTDPLRVLEQGPDRQRAPGRCSGGLSSIRGASEFDALMIEPPMDLGNPFAAIGHRSSSPAMAVHEGGFMTTRRRQVNSSNSRRLPFGSNSQAFAIQACSNGQLLCSGCPLLQAQGQPARPGAAGAALARRHRAQATRLRARAHARGSSPPLAEEPPATAGLSWCPAWRGQPRLARSCPPPPPSAIGLRPLSPAGGPPPPRACPAENLLRRAPARRDSGTPSLAVISLISLTAPIWLRRALCVAALLGRNRS